MRNTSDEPGGRDAGAGVQSVDRALTILEVLARVGDGVLRLAGATSARLDVVQEARSVCRQLAAETGETVNIAVLSESSALYLDQVAGSSALQPHNWVGQHIPLHATSNGKVLLSELDETRRDQVLVSLTGYTDQTITRKAA